MDEGPVSRRAPVAGARRRIRLAARRLAPSRYHRAFAARLVKNANARYEPPAHPRYSLLVVNHYFDQDIYWLRRAAPDVAIYELPYLVFFEAAASELPPTAERFPGYYAPELARGRERFRSHTADIFEGVASAVPYDTVASTSDLFWWAREFQPVLRDRGIPYAVIEKEGLMTPYFYEHYSREFREHCPPIADHHLVWSDRQSYFWQLCGQDPARISVVGQPRSDFWQHPEVWPSREALGLSLRDERPLAVFFSYEHFFYLSWEMFLRGEFTWQPLRDGTNEAILETASRNPHADFVVKLHPQQADSGFEGTELPPNLRIVGGSRLGNPLLLNADVLVMFQSTATVEAMFRDVPIVYPFFGESVQRHLDSLLPFHEGEITTVARSPVEIVEAIEQGLVDRKVDAQTIDLRRQFLEDYLHRPDGHASRRAVDRLGELAAQERNVASSASAKRPALTSDMSR